MPKGVSELYQNPKGAKESARCDEASEMDVKKYQAEIDKLKEKNQDLFYTLVGVMFSIDKWLEGDELRHDKETRASIMREKVLKMIESQEQEIEQLKLKIAEQEKEIDAMRCALNLSESDRCVKAVGQDGVVWASDIATYDAFKEAIKGYGYIL